MALRNIVLKIQNMKDTEFHVICGLILKLALTKWVVGTGEQHSKLL